MEQHSNGSAAELLRGALHSNFPSVQPEILQSLVDQLLVATSNEARFAELFATFLVEFRDVDNDQRLDLLSAIKGGLG